MRTGRATFAALAILACVASALRPSAAEVKALEPTDETEAKPAPPCAHGLVINGKCECKDGWTGAECDMAVEEAPPKYEGKLEPTRDYHFTADDRWICPGGCSTHGHCDGETRTCACTDEWTGDACQRTEFMAERSDPALEKADELPLEAHVLLPEAEVPAQAERLLQYLVEMRTRIKVLKDRVASKEDAEDRVALEEDKEELAQTNATLHEFGGYRRLAQEREDYRRAQLEDMKEHYDDLVEQAGEKERHQVVEDALEDSLRRTIVDANSKGPEVKLGEFALFHSKASVAAMDEGSAKKVVRDIDIGEPFEHEVERHTMSEHTKNNFVVPK